MGIIRIVGVVCGIGVVWGLKFGQKLRDCVRGMGRFR